MAKERLETQPTHLPGVSFQVEPGTVPDILRKTTEHLLGLGQTFYQAKKQIEAWTDEQGKRHKEIVNIAKEHEGLRGIISEESNLKLLVYPSEKVTYARELLKESLGDALYAALTTEALVVKISVPAGFQTKNGVTISEEILSNALQEALRTLGFTKEDLVQIMEPTVKPKIDEEELNKRIDQGKVTLEHGAKSVEKTWNVRVSELKKAREQNKEKVIVGTPS